MDVKLMMMMMMMMMMMDSEQSMLCNKAFTYLLT